jgi:putative phosphoribosyl transferase
MFRDREDAARHLAAKLQGRPLHDPLVLAIPRGGVVLGAVLARALDAELDIVLSRKLRAPKQPELTIGALAEDGTVYLDPKTRDWSNGEKEYLEIEKRFQASEIARRKMVFRAERPAAPIAGRSVIVTADGIATGATMLVTLDVIRDKHPREVIVAVPVWARDPFEEISKHCDDTVWLTVRKSFFSVEQFYLDFRPVGEQETRLLLRQFATEAQSAVAPCGRNQAAVA